MKTLKLFMLLLGCKPHGRHTEQHDVFFSIGKSLIDLLPDIYNFWPEAEKKIHIDAWREVNIVDDSAVKILQRTTLSPEDQFTKLFFINLGGYKKEEFEEYHYKMLVTGSDKGIAIQKAKQTAFYKHTGFKEAASHIDDKYGIDVDDIYQITDILPASVKQKYSIILSPSADSKEDEMHLGYFRLENL